MAQQGCFVSSPSPLLFSLAYLLALPAQGAQGGVTPPSPPAPAETQDGDEPEVEILGAPSESVVIATRYPEDPSDVPATTLVVDKKEILELNGRTAADALCEKPGIWIQKTGALGGAPILRGFMGNQVVYMFDGIRRNTAGLFAGPNAFLQTVDGMDIDRIEVVLGPGSVLYGSDAIGGVINVITNEEPLFSDATQLGGRSYSRFASADHELSQRLESYVSTPDVYVAVGGTYRDFDDLSGGRDTGLQSPSGWYERDYDAQVDWRLDERSTLELFFQDFSRPKGYRYDRPNWVQEDDRELLGLRWRAEDLGAVSNLEVTGYYHDQSGYIDELFFDSDTRDRTVGFDGVASSNPSDSVRLTYGVHVHKDDLLESDPQSGTAEPDVTWLNPAAFALAEWQATERVRLDLGVRFDSYTLESNAPALGELDQTLQDAIGSGAFALEDLELDDTDGALTGGVGMVVAATDEVSLFTHVGRAFRAPNKSDLLSFGQFTFGFEVPTTDLEPESSITYELGARADMPDWSGTATTFYTEIDDAIVSSPGTFNGQTFIDVNGNGIEDPGEQVYVNQNSTGTVKAVGVELDGRAWAPDAWNRKFANSHALSYFGSFAWIYGEDTGSGEPLDRAYPANALIGVRVDESRESAASNWWAQVDLWLVRAFHRIPSFRKTSDPAFFHDPQDLSSGLIGGDGSLPGFGILSLRTGFRLSANTTLYAAAENVLDESYRVKDSRIDGPGASLIFGLEIGF